MEPIFNFRAQIVGWLEGEIAFNGNGYPMAFLSGGAVFAVDSGHYLGQSDSGVFRDRLGCIVAFVRGSAPCAALTTPQETRPPPCIQSRALPDHSPVPTSSPHRAEPLLNKSSLDWERFVTGCEAHWPWKTRR